MAAPMPLAAAGHQGAAARQIEYGIRHFALHPDWPDAFTSMSLMQHGFTLSACDFVRIRVNCGLAVGIERSGFGGASEERRPTRRMPAPACRRRCGSRRCSTAWRGNGFVTVSEAARRLGVSEMTVRRDLLALEAKGLVNRTHGGAVRREVFDAEEPIFDRRRARQRSRQSRDCRGRRRFDRPARDHRAGRRHDRPCACRGAGSPRRPAHLHQQSARGHPAERRSQPGLYARRAGARPGAFRRRPAGRRAAQDLFPRPRLHRRLRPRSRAASTTTRWKTPK